MRSNRDRAKPSDPQPVSGGAVGDERRADPRHPADEPATIKLLNPLQTSARLSARVVEMSRGGMKLRLKQSLMPGTLVQIRCKGKLALGEVRYCTAAGSGSDYHAGIRLQDVLDTDLGDLPESLPVR